MKQQSSFVVALALFTMLFGAGNVVFPLILGRSLGGSLPFGMIGFVLSGVIVPMLGFIAVMKFRGDYSAFLRGLGTKPAFVIAVVCMTVLGPIGAIPRCISIAYADLAWYLPKINMLTFSIIAGLAIALSTFRRTMMIALLGRVLGPIKLFCLLMIGIVGLLSEPNLPVHEKPIVASITEGFMRGYGTMDLLAIVFFSQLFSAEIAMRSSRESLKRSVTVSLIAGCLLLLVYVGFAATAALHTQELAGIADDTMLSALASKRKRSIIPIFQC